MSHSIVNTEKIIQCQWSTLKMDISELPFASIFCQFSPGCSDGEWQLPNSITNYQQHFTIIRGNKSKHRELQSHPPLTVTKTPGRLKLFCQRKMLINHILTLGSRPVLDLANHQFGIFVERKFWWFSVSIVDNLRHLKKAKLALSHNQSQVFTENPQKCNCIDGCFLTNESPNDTLYQMRKLISLHAKCRFLHIILWLFWESK